MTTDAQLQELYEIYLGFADTLCAEYGPMEVAAIMMALSMSIYKSALSEEDFNKMVDNMSESRDKVKTFERPVVQ